MFRTFASVIVAFCAASASASPAHAEQPGYKTMSVSVSYADLDIGSDAGAKTLVGRLTRASRQVCGEHPGPQHLKAAMQFQSCVDTAMTDAISQVKSARMGNHQTAQAAQQTAGR